MNKNKDLSNVNEVPEDSKRRYSIYIHESTIELAQNNYENDGCKCASDFVEKAIRFYAEYIQLENCSNVIPNIITNTIDGAVKESNAKQGRMLFKIAVELSLLSNILASQYKLSEEQIGRLRTICASEVKRVNGAINFEEAVRWQS